MLELICHGAFSYNQIKGKPVKPVVKSWRPGSKGIGLKNMRRSDSVAPRSHAQGGLSDDGAPTSRWIQDLYDINTTPRIALGRVVAW